MWLNRPHLVELCALILSTACLRLATAYSKSYKRTPELIAMEPEPADPARNSCGTYVMDEYCDDLIDMEQRDFKSIRLRLTESNVYRPHMSCSFAVRAPPRHRIVLVLENLDIAEGRFGFCSDYLAVWDGAFNRTSTVDGIADKLCGDVKPSALTSRGRTMTLHFDSNTLEDGAGFSAILTAYHEGECDAQQEFTCDNGRCIDRRLKCDDYDNCGDFSDDCRLSVGDVVTAVMVTSFLFLLIVGGAILYCHRDKIQFRKKCPVIVAGADPDGVYQPTTELVTDSATGDTTAV